MKIIGLTGGIASGKSTVAKMLEHKNIPVVCADTIAKQLVAPKSSVLKELVKAFGREILNRDQTLNRQKLGSLVFGNPQAIATLNQIVHPAVISTFKKEIKRYQKQKTALLVLDVPLLFEAGLDQLCDQVITVYVPRTLQIARLKKRDSFLTTDAKKRIASQMSLLEKKKKADFVIDNRGTIKNSQKQLEKILSLL